MEMSEPEVPTLPMDVIRSLLNKFAMSCVRPRNSSPPTPRPSPTPLRSLPSGEQYRYGMLDQIVDGVRLEIDRVVMRVQTLGPARTDVLGEW